MVRFVWFSVCVFVALPFNASGQDVRERFREITPIRGDLYQVRDGDQVTVFLAAPDAILLVDPLNSQLARWLKTEFEARFPGRPVRYVVCSSHRYERAAGAWTFTETAEIVGHQAFESERQRAAKSLPRSWTSFDRNQNGILERSEAVALGAEALTKDRNKDGHVTPAEAWGDVSWTETRYQRRRVIELGGRRIELIHPGDGLGDDLTLILFPAERVLFAPGVPFREAPPSFASISPTAFVETLRQIEGLAFDTVLSERGETSTVADLALVREYVEEMIKGVRAGFKAGDTLEQLQTTLDLERFSQLRNFDMQRGRNIDETFRGLRLITIALSGAGQFVHVQRGVPDCALNAIPTFQVACEGVGGPTFAGSGGIAIMGGRAGGSVEVSRGGVMTGSDQRFISGLTAFEHRETVAAFMFRYEAVQTRGGLGVVLAAGIAGITATQRIDGPINFYSPSSYETTTATTTNIFGADLTASAGPLKFIVPIRLMRAPEDMYRSVGGNGPKWNMRFGIGFAVPLARVVL
jgi:hypothetical protein